MFILFFLKLDYKTAIYNEKIYMVNYGMNSNK